MAAAHLAFGGSNAHRWLRCAGSTKLCATVPPRAPNEHMLAGTRAHSLLELALSRRTDNVLEFEGQSLTPGDPVFTAEDVEAVQVAVDYVGSLLQGDAEMWLEQAVRLSDEVGGTVDVMVYRPRTKVLHSIDYKHGEGKFVDVNNNPQLKLYASAALLAADGKAVDKIVATIIQPRCRTGDAIRSVEYTPADLIVFSDEVDAAVVSAKADAPTFTVGDWCDWCPAASVCPGLQQDAFAELLLPEGSSRVPAEKEKLVLLPDPASLRYPDAMAKALNVVEVLGPWVKAVKAEALDMLRTGATLPGFKLVATRPSRKFTDPATAVKWFESNTMLDTDQFAPRKLVSVAAGEKLVKTYMGAEGVKHLAALVTKESSGVKIVSEGEAGEPVNPVQLMTEGVPLPIEI